MRVFIGLVCSMFSISLMQLILATALPFIVVELGDSELYGWIFSVYMLASIFTIPLFSKLADLYDKKTFLLVGIGVFALGSLCGGFATSMAYLIGARVIQGLGAGIITPIVIAMISDLFDAEKRARMIGYFGTVQLVANLSSPILGSYITKTWGWEWIFFLNVGMICLGGILVSEGAIQSVRHKAVPQKGEVDLFGGLTFGLFCILAVGLANTLTQSPRPLVLGLMICAMLGMGLLLLNIERKHPNPVVKVAFFQNQVLRRAIISAFLIGAVMYGMVNILPLFGVAMGTQGLAFNESNILLVFMVSMTLGMVGSSRFVGKAGNTYLTKGIWIVLLFGLLCLAFSVYQQGFHFIYAWVLLIGAGTGGMMATFMIHSQNAAQPEERTVLSGLIQLSRYFGASLGVIVLTGLLSEVSFAASSGQFAEIFGILALGCACGLVNECI